MFSNKCVIMHQGSRPAGLWEGPRRPRSPGRGSSHALLWSRWCSRPPARRWDWRKPTGAGWFSASRAHTLAARVASLGPDPWVQTHNSHYTAAHLNTLQVTPKHNRIWDKNTFTFLKCLTNGNRIWVLLLFSTVPHFVTEVKEAKGKIWWFS